MGSSGINGKYTSKQWILKKLTSEENILDQKVNGEAYAASSVACLPNALGERFLEKEISSVIGSQDKDADNIVNHGSGVKSSIPKDDKEIKSGENLRPNADLGNNDVIIRDNTDVFTDTENLD